jgi:hypothetical protein
MHPAIFSITGHLYSLLSSQCTTYLRITYLRIYVLCIYVSTYLRTMYLGGLHIVISLISLSRDIRLLPRQLHGHINMRRWLTTALALILPDIEKQDVLLLFSFSPLEVRSATADSIRFCVPDSLAQDGLCTSEPPGRRCAASGSANKEPSYNLSAVLLVGSEHRIPDGNCRAWTCWQDRTNRINPLKLRVTLYCTYTTFITSYKTKLNFFFVN